MSKSPVGKAIVAQPVVIVSGPPGSGKSSVAAALASGARRGVHLESDWFYRTIRSDFVAPYLPAANVQNTAVLDAVTDAAAVFAESGYRVFWDGVVGPWFLDRVSRRLAARGVSLQYLVVRSSEKIALERIRRRDGNTVDSGAAVMWGQFAELGDLESHVVASDGPLEVVIDQCREALSAGQLQVDSAVWVDDRWPVSVKGVLSWGDQVIVLRNERDEWELPGGRLDATDASPEDALRREFDEELGIDVEVGPLIDSWIYDVAGKRVLVMVYSCSGQRPPLLTHSDEHVAVGTFSPNQLVNETIPEGYLRSIDRALRT